MSTEPSPRLHDLTPLVERVSAAIGKLGLIASGMGQTLLDHFACETSSLAGPIPER
jgi:hypothetical protein